MRRAGRSAKKREAATTFEEHRVEMIDIDYFFYSLNDSNHLLAGV